MRANRTIHRAVEHFWTEGKTVISVYRHPTSWRLSRRFLKLDWLEFGALLVGNHPQHRVISLNRNPTSLRELPHLLRKPLKLNI